MAPAEGGSNLEVLLLAELFYSSCMRRLIVASVLLAIASGVSAKQDGPKKERDEAEYSPLGFYDLRAYEQAYPGVPGSTLVTQAAGAKYWAYRGIAYRGADPLGNVWLSLGPETNIQDPNTQSGGNISGRVSAIVISPTCDERAACRLWVGAGGGGVWRTDDAMHTTDPKWRWVSRGLGTNSIGSLALDLSDRTGNTIYAGTGETNTPQNSGAGTGLYKSTDAGDNWTRVPTMIVDPTVSAVEIDFTSTRGISTVIVEPNHPQTLYVATTTAMLGMTAVRGGQTQVTGYPQPRTGLYKTENGGLSWKLIWTPPLETVFVPSANLGTGVRDTMSGVRHVKLDPKDSSIVYATAWNNAIHRSAPSLENGDASFKPVFTIVGAGRQRDLAMFDLVVKDGHTRVYVYNGTESLNDQGLYRVDNADVPASELVTVSNGLLANTSKWAPLTSNSTAQPGSLSRQLCGSQCFYDLVVASPADQPDTVVIGGQLTPTFGVPTLRSTNAGVSFQDFASDAQSVRNESHVDVRVVAFHPRNSNIAFVGSDGGVVRNDGQFLNMASRCPSLFGTAAHCSTLLAAVPQRIYFLNKGLQTLQFYNIALDPKAPLKRLIGGLQDNSTIWQDGTGDGRTWRTLFPFGDGTSASGFHPARSEVTFASFQSNRFFTNFRNGDLNFWVRTDDPIRAANELATVTASTGRQFLTFDNVNPNTQFTGFQHIWRTQNNGGSQTTLEASCKFPGGSSSASCGDWIPLGVTYPFATGSTQSSTSRQPGDLTSNFYGSDRSGGIIVAAERAQSDAGTLWAATSTGRLFVAKNADAAGVTVQFNRVDSSAMPNRFVTRIVVDRGNPNVAILAYTGFNQITPTTPGHIFRAVYDPASGRATFTRIDADLGDIPVNTIAYDDLRGDLYAGTDYGPIVLKRGSATWQGAGFGFPEALIVDLKIVPEQRTIVAATHGLGIFYLTLPPV